MKPPIIRFAAGLSSLLAMSPFAGAIVTFSFNYADVTNNSGAGFDDPALGVLRRNTLEDVANNYLGLILDHTATVEINVGTSTNSGSSTLASAGQLYFTVNNTFQPGILTQHVQTGTDPLVGTHDGIMNWNFGPNYSYGGAVGSSQVDFRSVALHELTHALGFASLSDENGDGLGGNPVYGVFDEFLFDANGDRIFAPNGTFVGDTNDFVSEVTFRGANAMAANGGNPVVMFTPAAYEEGSSVSHFDQAMFGATAVMSPAILTGTQKRAYSAIDIAVLEDLGYQFDFSNVPEPSSALSICLAGGLLTLRRRR